MNRAGFSSPQGLHVVADVWKKFRLTEQTQWSEAHALNVMTLERLLSDSLATDVTSEEVATILESWTFPLYGRELELITVGIATLRDRQRGWVGEMG
jgi:hypothetical protein